MPGEFSPRCEPPRTLVRPVPLDPTGRRGPTRGQAQGGRWRRTTKGFYVPSTVSDAVPEQRVLEQSMRLPSGGAVTGWAACRLAGAAYFDGLAPDGRTPRPVALVVPPQARARSLPGSRVGKEPLAPTEVAREHGIACTVPVRALFDEMRSVDVREAVVAMDMMAAAELVSLVEMGRYLAERTSWRRATRVSAALPLASERSLSPNETRMRLVWRLDAHLPPPLVNQPVWDLDGRLLGVADLFDAVSGLAVEYDGATHLRAGQRARDVLRDERFRAAGVEVVTVTAPDVHEPLRLAHRMHAARRRALAAPHRGWTLNEPSTGWLPTPTAEDRLALRDRLRAQGRAV